MATNEKKNGWLSVVFSIVKYAVVTVLSYLAGSNIGM